MTLTYIFGVRVQCDTVRVRTSRLYAKVHDNSRKENVSKAVGATSSEGFFSGCDCSLFLLFILFCIGPLIRVAAARCVDVQDADDVESTVVREARRDDVADDSQRARRAVVVVVRPRRGVDVGRCDAGDHPRRSAPQLAPFDDASRRISMRFVAPPRRPSSGRASARRAFSVAASPERSL